MGEQQQQKQQKYLSIGISISLIQNKINNIYVYNNDNTIEEKEEESNSKPIDKNELLLSLFGWNIQKVKEDPSIIQCSICLSKLSFKGDCNNLIKCHKYYCPYVYVDKNCNVRPGWMKLMNKIIS